jgi:hypothetical protein
LPRSVTSLAFIISTLIDTWLTCAIHTYTHTHTHTHTHTLYILHTTHARTHTHHVCVCVCVCVCILSHLRLEAREQPRFLLPFEVLGLHLYLAPRGASKEWQVHRAFLHLVSVKRDLVSVKRDLVSVKRDLVSVKRDLLKSGRFTEPFFT